MCAWEPLGIIPMFGNYKVKRPQPLLRGPIRPRTEHQKGFLLVIGKSIYDIPEIPFV
jgi:hypothetical protein